jgi:hypothetical protein
VSHKLMLSMFTQPKMLALRYAPIDVELTLATPSEWLYSKVGTTNLSQSYVLSNVQLQYTANILDESIQESFYRSLLSQRVLNTPLQQCFQIVQSIPAGSTTYSMSIVRAFSKLTHVWVTFRSAKGALCNEFMFPTLQTTSMTTTYGTNPIFDQQLPSPSLRLSLGAHNWPQFEPVNTVQEHYWQLMQALSAVPMLDRKDFCTSTAPFVFDLRRTPGDAASAYSTRQGDQLRLDIKGLTPWDASGTGAQGPIEVHTTLFCLAALSTRESGCQILD